MGTVNAPEQFTTMRSLTTALAKAMNLINPEVEHHHEQTAYLSLFITRAMGLPEEDEQIALYAALLHDIGSIRQDAPQSLEEVERNAREVSLVGAKMLGDLPGFQEIAQVIAFCQCNWRNTVAGAIERGDISARLGLLASIVHVADAVSVLVRPNERVLNQSQQILDLVKRYAGTEFHADVFASLEAIAENEFVWLDLMHNPMFLTYFTGDIAPVSLERTVELTGFISRVIDYRSPFTAMHSAGVAATTRELAALAGFPDKRVMEMQVAGNLHDIGKLAVPRSILEKPGRLTDEEFNVIKEHPYYTSLVLMNVEGFDDIRDWAMKHHEKLNGRGYPFHYPASELNTGDRILAVADIFSAITEERPYRSGMSREQAAKVLQENVHNGEICGDVVTLLLDNYECIDSARDLASRKAGKRYFESMEK